MRHPFVPDIRRIQPHKALIGVQCTGVIPLGPLQDRFFYIKRGAVRTALDSRFGTGDRPGIIGYISTVGIGPGMLHGITKSGLLPVKTRLRPMRSFPTGTYAPP